MTTKLRIITSDKVESTFVTDSELPVQSKTIKAALDAKVDKVTGKQLSTEDYTTEEKTKLAGIAAGAEVNVQPDWSATSGDAAIQNKPFTSIGAGLSVASGVLSADSRLHFEIVTALPETGDAQTIYLKANSGSGQNVFDEYIYVNKGTTAEPEWVFEKIGSTEFNLTIDQSATGIKINDTALQAATNAQTGLLTAADYVTFAAKQNALTFDSTPTAESENPVKSSGIKTALDTKVNIAQGTDKAGKILKVNSEGNVECADAPSASWGNITGTLANQTDLKTELDSKVTKVVATGQSDFVLGVDANGYYLETQD